MAGRDLMENVLRLKLDLRCAVPRTDAHNLVWICVDRSATTTVKELAKLIRAKCGLEKKCELYYENAWLPPYELIHILGDKDLVRVVTRHKGSTSYTDDSARPAEDEFPVEKRKKRKRSASEDSNLPPTAEVDSADDTATVNSADPSASTPIKSAATHVPLTEWPQATPTFHSEVLQSPSPAGIPTALPNDSAAKDSATKRKKRRPRKKKPKVDTAEAVQAVPAQPAIFRPPPFAETPSQGKHVVFNDDSDEDGNEEEEEAEPEQDSQAALTTSSAHTVKVLPLPVKAEEAFTQPELSNGGAWPKPALSFAPYSAVPPPWEDAPEQVDVKEDSRESVEEAAPATADAPPKCKKDYSQYPPLKTPPRVGDVIAFKVLELDYNYCPNVSEYKEGKVVHYNSMSDMIRVQLRNAEAKKTYGGKFELETIEEGLPPMQKEVELLWTELLEPRVLS
ncbi:uncharacterized protein LOC144137883 [Haemaphysalis longicornis]